ncbi:hypothetical protein BpHYR1_008555 [Brachionus plicatilis]|uniref:Uncharacterized protein n=1 Tax=Brachionus plicatilis TaxID=10195 RepID=A0A3M7PEE3_BRAPC|nr:hypothetical protein BpHYR1_008555 [Brachionus plicatilis]
MLTYAKNMDDENCSQISNSEYDRVLTTSEQIEVEARSSEQEDVSESNVLTNDTGVRGRGRPKKSKGALNH